MNKFVETAFRIVFHVPDWIYGREALLKFLFMYLMIDAMHKANEAARTLEA